MSDRAFVFTLVVLLSISSQFVYGQQTGERNLQICLTGKYPALCDHSELTRDQATTVREAERAENLRVCLTGKYPALCDHSELTRDQATTVREAERAEKQIPFAEVGAKVDRYPEASNARPTCYESSIMSPTPFMGNHGEVLRLADGSLWEVQYEYEYMYEYYPDVIICPSRGTLVVGGKTLSVQLITTTMSQRQLVATADVVESRIEGEFSGWEGDTIFKLQNGQLWQQSLHAYKYRYLYSPEVLIYKSGSVYKMRVDGVDDEIEVQRLK